MEALPELATLAPSAGVFGLLAWLIVHTMRQSSSDRTAYGDQLRNQADRHDKQLQDLEHRLEQVRSELASVREQLEVERRARWKAEDEAARYRRMTGATNADS